MNLKYENTFTPHGGIARLEHEFKGVSFEIFIEEEINEDDAQSVHVVFRTPKGKYRIDIKASKELIDTGDELEFKEMVCAHVHGRKNGWD